ncbi:MAG: patatin-like phospholipase family protein [Anaerolineae bacterium]|nr:patatin-like phospholipase family protein [Anaerolineae bacterium]
MFNFLKASLDQPTIGLALGGGGARGLAHVGVLKALEREGIPFDFIAGTSMGGIIGAMYAAGMSVVELEEEALYITRPRNMLRFLDLTLARTGLISAKGLRDYLVEKLGGDLSFDQMTVPLAVVAVDLISGEEVHLHEGSVVDAVRATSAFPGVIDPVKIDSYRFTDGGVLNNVPADVAREMGADIVIAVDVGLDFYDIELVDSPTTPPPMRIVHNAWRAQSLSSQVIVNRRLEAARPDVILHPSIPGEVSAVTGFHRAPDIIAAGEACVSLALPRIRRLARARLKRLRRVDSAD